MLEATGDDTITNLLTFESEIREEMLTHVVNHKEHMAESRARVGWIDWSGG